MNFGGSIVLKYVNDKPTADRIGITIKVTKTKAYGSNNIHGAFLIFCNLLLICTISAFIELILQPLQNIYRIIFNNVTVFIAEPELFKFSYYFTI